MSKIIVITNQLGELGTNSYIVANTETRQAIVIDPADEAPYIQKCLVGERLQCVGIFLTHGHYDHMAAMQELKKLVDVKTYACEDEKQILESQTGNLSAMFGHAMTAEVDEYLKDGAELSIIGTTMKCIAVPGHTAGGMCYYFPEAGVLFSGDTLFAASVGRSDFPTGNGQELLDAIGEKLLVLPEDTIVYPGHNDRTKIGREKKLNPFFR